MMVSGARYVPNENTRTMKWRVCERVDKMSIASFCRVRAFYYIPYLNDIEGDCQEIMEFHRGRAFVPSWWYVCTIVVVRLYHHGGTFVPSWWYNFYIVGTRLPLR